jgi:hypothetical protein
MVHQATSPSFQEQSLHDRWLLFLYKFLSKIVKLEIALLFDMDELTMRLSTEHGGELLMHLTVEYAFPMYLSPS